MDRFPPTWKVAILPQLARIGAMPFDAVKLPERMPGAELTAHAGCENGKEAPPAQADRRNGVSRKVSKGQAGELPLAVPRDRDSSFGPETVKMGQTRIGGTDDKIIHSRQAPATPSAERGLYAAGLTVRDIQAGPPDLRGLKVSPHRSAGSPMTSWARSWNCRAARWSGYIQS